MQPAFDAKLPDGWYRSDSERAAAFAAELALEVSPGHLLFGKDIEVVAHREGTDDILCRHTRDCNRFTVVHLSWIRRAEVAPHFPTIEVDGSLGDFYEYERRFGIDC